jgi:DNA-binding transcriptional LysR family regulator
MSLSRLRTFIEVYRQKSISAAARSLNLTQPAVSQHIAGLEATIGRRLFVRESQGVSPTAAADELAADVGDKLDSAEAALASARARSVEVAGALQIVGHVDFLAEVVAAELVPLLEVGVRVRLQSGDRDLIHHMLIDGDSDLGITAFPTADPRLRSELIRTERVLAVAAPAVAQRIQKAKDFKSALLAEPLLAYSLEIPLIDQWLEKNALGPLQVPPAMIGQDLRSLRSLLCRGFGWTALPEYLCREYLGRGELVEIAAPVAPTTLSYFLTWTPIALRQARVAHARQTLLWRLAGEKPRKA